MSFHKIDGPVFAWHGPGGPVDPGWGVGGSERPDNSLPWGPGRPSHPIALPPLPGIWPKPGEPSIPPGPLPPVEVAPPIYIEGSPTNPIALPPGIYPPLPPEAGLPSGKIAILILVVGVGYRWLVYDRAQVSPPIAGTPTPKG